MLALAVKLGWKKWLGRKNFEIENNEWKWCLKIMLAKSCVKLVVRNTRRNYVEIVCQNGISRKYVHAKPWHDTSEQLENLVRVALFRTLLPESYYAFCAFRELSKFEGALPAARHLWQFIEPGGQAWPKSRYFEEFCNYFWFSAKNGQTKTWFFPELNSEIIEDFEPKISINLTWAENLFVSAVFHNSSQKSSPKTMILHESPIYTILLLK